MGSIKVIALSFALLVFSSVVSAKEYQGKLGVYEGDIAPFFTGISIADPVHMPASEYVRISVFYGGGCGQHYYDWEIVEADKEKKYLLTKLVHETNDTCEAGIGTTIYMRMPQRLGFWPEKWEITSGSVTEPLLVQSSSLKE